MLFVFSTSYENLIKKKLYGPKITFIFIGKASFVFLALDFRVKHDPDMLSWRLVTLLVAPAGSCFNIFVLL